MLTNPHDALRGQSRSSNKAPFDVLVMVSYCPIVQHHQYSWSSLRHTIIEIFDFKKCRDLETRVRGHSRSLKPTRIDPSHMTF